MYIAANEPIFEEIAEKYNVSYIHRTQESVMSETISGYLSFMHDLESEAVCWYNACCAFTSVETIQKAINRYTDEGCQTLLPIVRDGEIYFDDQFKPLTDEATVANIADETSTTRGR